MSINPLLFGVPNKTLTTIIILLICLAFGARIIHEGIGDVLKRRSLQKGPAESPGSVTSGPVVTSGVAQSLGSPATAPLSDGKSLLSKWRVGRSRGNRRDGDPPWKPVATGQELTPFLIEGENGSVTVDPSGATIDFGSQEDQEEVVRLRPTDKRPDYIKSFLEENDIQRANEIERSGERPVSGERRFVQWTVKPGDELTVCGEAIQETKSDLSSASGDTVIQFNGHTNGVISQKSRKELIKERSGSLRKTLSGIALVIVGIVGIIYILAGGSVPV